MSNCCSAIAGLQAFVAYVLHTFVAKVLEFAKLAEVMLPAPYRRLNLVSAVTADVRLPKQPAAAVQPATLPGDHTEQPHGEGGEAGVIENSVGRVLQAGPTAATPSPPPPRPPRPPPAQLLGFR
jgi:hypothetical protein